MELIESKIVSETTEEAQRATAAEAYEQKEARLLQYLEEVSVQIKHAPEFVKIFEDGLKDTEERLRRDPSCPD